MLCVKTSPVSETKAILHPCENPGSIPSIFFPFTGGVSSNCFKFVANTSCDAFSAFCFRSARICLTIRGLTKT